MGFEGPKQFVESTSEPSKEMEGIEKLKPITPGGTVPRYLLWETRVTQGTSQELAVKTPEGGHLRLQPGEHFTILRDREKDSYQAVIKDDEGKTIKIFEEGTLWGKEGGTILFYDGEAIAGGRVVQVLESAGEVGKIFARAYEAAAGNFPELRDVDIILGDPEREPVLKKTGGFARHQSQTFRQRPSVTVNARLGIEHYRNLMKERRVSAQISAEKAGIDPDKVTPEILAAFIFLHELGHARHYLIEPDGDKYREQRKIEMEALPFGNWNPGRLALALDAGGKLDTWYTTNEKILSQKGYPTRESIVEAQERAYHSINTEDIPDQFASKVIKEHFNKLFP